MTDIEQHAAANFVCREWQVAFFNIEDIDITNMSCAQVRNQLVWCYEISRAEIAMIKMKYPHLTTYDK